MIANTVTRAALTVTFALIAGATFASSHLHTAANSQGADNRGFDGPVHQNPSDVAGAKADPHTVPGLGDPSTGHENVASGTPAVNLDMVPIRSGRE